MSYTTDKRSQRLAIVQEGIKELIKKTLCQKWKIVLSPDLNVALDLTLIVQVNITKPNKESLLHHI